MEGYFKPRAMRELESCADDVIEPIGHGIYLQRNKIRSYYTDDFIFCLRAWHWVNEKHMLPYGGGWAEQPGDIVDIMEHFDALYGEWQKRQPKGK